jgi:hypothetical protein
LLASVSVGGPRKCRCCLSTRVSRRSVVPDFSVCWWLFVRHATDYLNQNQRILYCHHHRHQQTSGTATTATQHSTGLGHCTSPICGTAYLINLHTAAPCLAGIGSPVADPRGPAVLEQEMQDPGPIFHLLRGQCFSLNPERHESCAAWPRSMDFLLRVQSSSRK